MVPKPELTDKEDKVGLDNNDSLTTWTVNGLDIKSPATIAIHLAYSGLQLWVKKDFSCSVLKVLHVAPTCILPPGYWKFWQPGFLDTHDISNQKVIISWITKTVTLKILRAEEKGYEGFW